jgi:hypothetical protein
MDVRTENELRALVNLLADEDERIAAVAWAELQMAGDRAVPLLNDAVVDPDPLRRQRAARLLAERAVAAAEERWRRFASGPERLIDLEEGCVLLAQITGDSVDGKALRDRLDVISGMVRAHMPGAGALGALNEVLFDNLGFRGGDFGDPESHLLTGVLRRRIGIPITLAAVYLLVARRLDLPVSGVAMPGHYLTRYELVDGPVFVDCYNRGRLYEHGALVGLLEGHGLQFTDSYLAPCSDRFTLFRMMNNLERCYRDREEDGLADRVVRWRSYLGLERGR